MLVQTEELVLVTIIGEATIVRVYQVVPNVVMDKRVVQMKNFVRVPVLRHVRRISNVKMVNVHVKMVEQLHI